MTDYDNDNDNDNDNDKYYDNDILNIIQQQQQRFDTIFIYKFLVLITFLRFYGMYIDPGYVILHKFIGGS